MIGTILPGLLFFHQINCPAASGTVKFTVTFDKTVYTPDEPINATFRLQNNGKSPLYVNKRFYLSSEAASKEQKEVYLTITSPSGKPVECKYSYETGLPKTDSFELLAPGKEAVAEYPRNLRGFFDITEQGTYTVVAVYQNVYGKEIGLDAFMDKIMSAPVTFSVKKPGDTVKAPEDKQQK